MAANTQAIDALSTGHLHADLKGRSVRGVIVTLSSQGSLFVIQSISTIVLARLLTPADFGLVAMVTAISDLATPFADLGLSQATVQRNDINHDQVTALFWINLAVGLVFMLVMAGLGPVLAWFYKEPRLRDIAAVISLIFLIAGLRAQPEALLKRQMRFSALAIRNVASLACAVSLAIVIAWRGGGYWAVIAVPLVAQFCQMTLSWFMVRWRPTLPRRWTDVRSLVAFGGNVAASFLVFGVHRNADNILVGWYWGATPLGLYSRAYSLLMLPVRQLNAPIASVAIPAFSRIQSEPERFARFYLRAISLMVWFGAALFGFLFVGSGSVIRLALGKQWGAAAPVFQMLAISALGQLLLQSTVWLFISKGESARLFKLLLMISPFILGSFALGLPFGIKAVALSYSLVLLSILPWIMHFAFAGTKLTLARLGRAILYPLSLSLASILVSELALHVASPARDISKLMVIGFSFMVTYLLMSLTPRGREEVSAFKHVIKLLRPSEANAWSAA